MSKIGPWLKEHAFEAIGAVAAVVLLIFLFATSKKQGTVAPASRGPAPTPLTQPTPSTSAVTPADVQSAIQSALTGYTSSSQESADLSTLHASLASELQTAASQLQQAEQQDVTTVSGNLSQLGTNFAKLSNDYATFANNQTGTNKDTANALATQAKQISDLANQYSQGQPTRLQLNSLSSYVAGLYNNLPQGGAQYTPNQLLTNRQSANPDFSPQTI